jgi:hypothetical protein
MFNSLVSESGVNVPGNCSKFLLKTDHAESDVRWPERSRFKKIRRIIVQITKTIVKSCLWKKCARYAQRAKEKMVPHLFLKNSWVLYL